MATSVRRLRILLVKPDISSVSVGFSTLARMAPLDLLMVAASIPQHTPLILDMRLEPDAAFERTLASFKPDVVGITAYTAESWAAKALCRRAKRALPTVPVVVGGYHATMATEDFMAEAAVDFAVIGEGEQTFPALLAAIEQGSGFEDVEGIAYRTGDTWMRTAPRALVADLNTLPLPDWDLVDRYQRRYYMNVMGVAGSVETSRGCPFDCSFCSVWVFNSRHYRTKSPRRVLQELDRLPESIDVVVFTDDEFWVQAGRAVAIADAIAARPPSWRGSRWRYWAQVRTDDLNRHPELVEHWAAVGLKVLLLGIESHKDSDLRDLYHKRNTVRAAEFALQTMRRSGVEAWGCFIVNPDWDEQDFSDLADFVNRHEIAFPQFTVLTPLPGTVLTQRLSEAGQLDRAHYDFRLLDFLHASTPTRLPLRSFYENLAGLYARTSMTRNVHVYRRALRNGVIAREWLRSDAGRRVKGFLRQLSDVESYVKAHRLVGQEMDP